MTPRSLAIFVLSVAILSRCALASEPGGAVHSFVKQQCYECHDGETAEAGLDLKALGHELHDQAVFAKWVQVFDRVKAGEMPPPDVGDIPQDKRDRFLKYFKAWLSQHQQLEHQQLGRVRARRLTNLQLERTLQDLLGIDIPLAGELPDEPRTSGFTTVADGQPMSHFQLAGHLSLIDKALDEAYRRVATNSDHGERDFNARAICRKNPRRRCREPELIDGKAVTWASTLIYYGRLPATQAKENGWYRFTVKASALKKPQDRGVWCTVRSGKCVSSAPLLDWVTAFEVTEQPQEWTFDAWLPRGDMLEIRPGDSTLKAARFKGGQVGVGEGGPQNVPGLAIHSLTMKQIHQGPNASKIRDGLFGDLNVRTDWNRRERRQGITLDSNSPRKDAAKLVHQFAQRAFRRPVATRDVEPFVELVHDALAAGEPLVNAIRGGYRAILCSSRFLYLHEKPGRLDDYAIAARLSFLLWNTMPDAELMRLAKAEELSHPAVLRAQAERLIDDPRGRKFVRDFAHEWLDLSEIDFTQPDRRRFRTFDIVVQQSMLGETNAFLQRMLDENLSVTNLIDSDFTFLNSRLARFYQVERVAGDELRLVKLLPEHRRGGVLTQGAILKVTANGTTTSPVVRGVWVAERLLGLNIPPPPAGVPAIEPDIRGAKTIRQVLAKHRSDPGCARCHVKIDPPGFVLENFDPSGHWRDSYRINKGRKRGPAINVGYQLADGRPFKNLHDFQELVTSEPDRLARNVAEKLMTYGTGGPVSFVDRPVIDRIVKQTANEDYGFRSLLHAVIASPTFLNK